MLYAYMLNGMVLIEMFDGVHTACWDELGHEQKCIQLNKIIALAANTFAPSIFPFPFSK